MIDPWSQKTCLVTGASSGFGMAMAGALAARGATVLLNGRSVSRLQSAVDLLAATGADAHAFPGDVANGDDVERIAGEVNSRFGGLDLLCNCAGSSSRGRILSTTPADFQKLWETNFLGTVRMTQAFAETLILRSGHLINIGSLAGKVAPQFLGAYPATKFAVTAYSQQLRLELGPEGLHVLLVCPGPILRDETGPRYQEQAPDVPENAQQPGGGAKLKGIDPQWLASRIITACERRELELVVPAKVRWLAALAQISPRWGDWLLERATSGKQ